MKAAAADPTAQWRFACPRCHTAIDAGMVCPGCGIGYQRADGLQSFLLPERREHFARFVDEYTRIRLAEGRGANPATYYQQLPECDPAHPMAWQWGIRRCTVHAFDRRVAPGLRSGSKVMDLGAGCGWFSNHLASRGFSPCAVDLTIDAQDGLGACRHYNPSWPVIQAEYDRLPVPDGSVDAVIFNASLHYSTDYMTTLGEALRVLRSEGQLIVLESPIYKREESGRRMAAERHADFERRYGTRSDSIPSIEFLTWDMLDRLGAGLNVKWKVVRPWYGWKWAMRPWQAKLRRKREPSRFAILVGSRKESSRR